MRKLLFIIPILIILSACSVKKQIVEVPIETVRTEYINQLYRDSVFVHDSIDRYISGDTVYQYKYKYIYKYLNRTDTVVKTDSIQVPVEIKTTEIKEVVKKPKWYQTFFMHFGAISLLILIIFAGIKLNTAIKR